ncbi:hypothetical protein B0T25DRAFT_249663 [Lasiosphaeria hispida]|uniref:Uncharacterized protein n=1 Tax=Lasiosphaeria hispida TaxID=260671 RepID=A0AAJ0MD17_9PEZI|nr:hypothetical protein B0T25DRAFT_249663 [Lasiosphaeria hispida]
MRDVGLVWAGIAGPDGHRGAGAADFRAPVSVPALLARCRLSVGISPWNPTLPRSANTLFWPMIIVVGQGISVSSVHHAPWNYSIMPWFSKPCHRRCVQDHFLLLVTGVVSYSTCVLNLLPFPLWVCSGSMFNHLTSPCCDGVALGQQQKGRRSIKPLKISVLCS